MRSSTRLPVCLLLLSLPPCLAACDESAATDDAGAPGTDAAAVGDAAHGDALVAGDTSPGVDTTAPDGASAPDSSGAPDSTSAPDSAGAPDRTGSPVDECEQAGADWVFCSGFEEGNLDIWDDYDDNPDSTNHLMPDPGPLGLADNTVIRLRVPEGRGGADLVKVLPSSYDRLYARWYIKWEDGYDFDAPNHGGGLHAGARNLLGRSDYRPDGDDWFCSWIEPVTSDHRLNAYTYYRGMYMDCADPNGSCWGDHFPCMVDEGEVYCEQPQHRETVLPPVMVTGQWYCIEMMLDGGDPVSSAQDANGVLDFWVDGLEIGPWDDLWLRTTAELKLTILWLSLFHHAEHSVEGIMLDNVVVSTSRVGCL